MPPRPAVPPSPAPDVPPVLHELESEVMDAVWDAGETTVRLVMDALNRRADPPRAYTTYMTILARLYKKGLATRRREGKTDIYAPALTREEYRVRRAAAEVEQLVEEYGDAALSHFAARIAALDPERRRALERLAAAGA